MVQQAKVKHVLSGDTIILTSLSNPRNERTLSLAYVAAPRLRREGDEPFAVESRDFIRRLLVGRVIQFHVLYTLPTGNKREYGIITLQNGHQLPELSVAQGFLRLRDDAGKREESEEGQALLEKLKALEARAKAEESGLWDDKLEMINTLYELASPHEFLQKWRGKPMDAIVEKVLTGDRLIVRLMETPAQHIQTMVLIAGIRAPSTKRVNVTDGHEQAAEPYGEEAQQFVEDRLLQRKLIVHIVGVSPQNQLVGSVKHPMGDIAVFELEMGLARCIDFHATMLGQEMGALRRAERIGKDGQKGIFQGVVTPRATGAGEAEFVVTRVLSADTMLIRASSGSERRINLSSVRQPKPSDPKQAPFSADAKEFMRRKLIGKHVRVSIDGKRPANEGFDEREMATVVQNKENVALSLVESGFASVIRHRMDDLDRSPIYDELLLAEDAAQKEGKGMWGTKPPEAKQYVDYSENLEKAKRLTSMLSRQKRVPAIVDFVKGGSRFTLLIPRENAKLTFVLSGIQAPRSARNASEASEPFGTEAHELANKRLQQRDVEIDVEDNDKVGGFIGKLYINRDNFARILLEEGYASVRLHSAEKSGNAGELLAAERKAKEGRKGLWQDWDPSQDVDPVGGTGESDDPRMANGASNGDAAAGGISQSAPSKDYRDVIVTYVDPTNCHLKLQQVSPSTTGALTSLTAAFRALHTSSTSAPATLKDAPKAGDLVAAKFSADGEWYRARVRRNDREKKTSDIVFIDYGNTETAAWTALRPLGNADSFGTTKLKPQALDAALSFVQFPMHSAEYMADAAAWLERRCGDGRSLVARVDFTDPREGTLSVTIFDPQDEASEQGQDGKEGASVNADTVDEGWAMAGRKLARWERAQGSVLSVLRKREERAKKERLGIWEYGDLTED